MIVIKQKGKRYSITEIDDNLWIDIVFVWQLNKTNEDFEDNLRKFMLCETGVPI
jgi:hypothetical protein